MKRARLRVLKVGSPILTGEGQKTEATIISVSIHAGPHVTYEIAWWVGATRFTAWVEAWELKAIHGTQTQRIGFAS